MTNDGIVPADRHARIVAILCIVAGVALIALLPWIAELVASVGINDADPDKAMAQLIFRERLVIVVGSIANGALALICARRGISVIRAGSYPPPGMKMPWSVRKQTGWSALAVGFGLLTMAAMLVMWIALGFRHWPTWPW